MQAIELQSSYDLLRKVVHDLYSRRHSPVPGATAKAQLIAEAGSLGFDFNERWLGFPSFRDYVRTAPGIAVQTCLGSDMLLAPSNATDTLSAYAASLPIVRRDFWRAFISFPVANTVRLYDPDEDKIFYEVATTSRKGEEVAPITREEHLDWRRSFASEQPDATQDELVHALSSGGASVFSEFARRLRENPPVMHAWNRYFQKKVTDRVIEWAGAHGVGEDRWSSGISEDNRIGTAGGQAIGTQVLGRRAELYNFFDDLPLEDLLQLRVPLDWVLKVMRKNK